MELYRVTYRYDRRDYDVDLRADSPKAAKRRAFWTLAANLNADLDRLRDGFQAVGCPADCSICGAHLPNEDMTEHRRNWHRGGA